MLKSFLFFFEFLLFIFNWCVWVLRCLVGVSILWVVTMFNISSFVSSMSISFFVLFLYYSSRCFFKILLDLFAIDFFNSRVVRFEIVIVVLSLLYNIRLFIHYFILENNASDTLSDNFDNSIFFECEIWDMFGLLFINLKKNIYHIFLDYGFKGYPLRKDFSLFGYFQIGFGYFSPALFLWKGYFANLKNKFESCAWSCGC